MSGSPFTALRIVSRVSAVQPGAGLLARLMTTDADSRIRPRCVALPVPTAETQRLGTGVHGAAVKDSATVAWNGTRLAADACPGTEISTAKSATTAREIRRAYIMAILALRTASRRCALPN